MASDYSKLKIATFNVQGIRNKKNEKPSFIFLKKIIMIL